MNNTLGLIGTLTLAAATNCATARPNQTADELYTRAPMKETILFSNGSCAAIATAKYKGDSVIYLSTCSADAISSGIPGTREFNEWMSVRGRSGWEVQHYKLGLGCACPETGGLDTSKLLFLPMSMTFVGPDGSGEKVDIGMGKQELLFKERLEEVTRALYREK